MLYICIYMVEGREPIFEIRKHEMSGMAMSQEILTTLNTKTCGDFFSVGRGGILDCVKKS